MKIDPETWDYVSQEGDAQASILLRGNHKFAGVIYSYKITECAIVMGNRMTTISSGDLGVGNKAQFEFEIRHLPYWDGVQGAPQNTIIGGSALSLATLQEFDEVHNVNVIHAWGMTETSPTGTVLAAEDSVRKLGSTILPSSYIASSKSC